MSSKTIIYKHGVIKKQEAPAQSKEGNEAIKETDKTRTLETELKNEQTLQILTIE